jgi:predicted transcriptional regulator
MSSKQIALEVISKLPDEASLMDIAHELEFVAGIREGAAELDRGEHLTAEDLRQRIPAWAKATK